MNDATYIEFKRNGTSGYSIWQVEPSLSGQAGATRTLVGYATSEVQVKKFYPQARLAA